MFINPIKEWIADIPPLMKTREEGGGTNSCEEQKQAAYKQAKADYENATTNCQGDNMPLGCIAQAAAKYDRNNYTTVPYIVLLILKTNIRLIC